MPVRAEGHVTVDKSRPDDFIDFDVHALVGGSYIMENYVSCYPEISDLNAGMGAAFGVGAGVRFNIRGYLGLGTELNFTRNAAKMDMAVVGSDRNSVSNVFQRNSYYKVDHGGHRPAGVPHLHVQSLRHGEMECRCRNVLLLRNRGKAEEHYI